MTTPRILPTVEVPPATQIEKPEHLPMFASIATMKQPPQDTFLIDRVLKPNTMMMLAASDGVGKSHLRRQLGMSLAIGPQVEPLFGYYPVKAQCQVLVADEENGEAEEWAAEEKILGGLNIDRAACLFYQRMSYAGINLEDSKWQQHLIAQCIIAHDEQPDMPVVLVLDHISLMVNTEWGEELKQVIRFLLQQLNDNEWLTIVLIAHMVKPDRTGKAPKSVVRELQDVLGNLPRSMSSVAIVSDLGDERIIWQMHKRVPKSSIVLVRDNGLWNFLHEASAARLIHNIETNDVIAAIAARGGQITANQLAIALSDEEEGGKKIGKRTAARVLADMEAAGELSSYALGNTTTYTLAGRVEPQ